MTLGALVFLYIKTGIPYYFPFAHWLQVVFFIIGCYVCGLISFSVGRAISTLMFRRETLSKTLLPALHAHKFNIEERMTPYLTGDVNGIWHLYLRMWSEVVHEQTSPVLLHHLLRYWAMSATYDGIAFSFIIWAIVLMIAQFACFTSKPIEHPIGLLGTIFCLIISYFAFRQGVNYYKYQISDIVAHFAVKRGSLITGKSV